ncbi:hypothetical protein Clacol_008825 [Clathrus columnatus]|uniref:Uncharacterized protein n=1 Tax=Clathrus columnatus TaxID=1419009 RepID=A0AAV5ARP4_9AGAM|nr:hypothetical protein Clacol_008825 [Clathrus columnatus]
MTARPPIYSNYPFVVLGSNVNANETSPTQSRRPVTLPLLPELHLPFDQVLHSVPSRPSASPTSHVPLVSHPFLDSLKDFQNHTETWNGAAAFRSTLSPTLNAFEGLSQATELCNVADLLDRSWRADPDATLRIIWNLRSIHQGKAAKEMFYRAFGWLYHSHPKTAIVNLPQLVDPVVRYTIKQKSPPLETIEDGMEVITHEEANNTSVTKTTNEIENGRCHGYWKDLLNILLLATTNELTPESKLSALGIKQRRRQSSESPDTRTASDIRGEKYKEWHNRIIEKLNNDVKFRILYVRVAQLFANALSRDMNILKQIADTNITAEQRVSLTYDLTLVGKWAPSLNASHDRMTNIATAIAQLLYGQGQLPITEANLEQPFSQENAHKLRSAYARWITTPLRRYLQIPEVAMSARRWDKIKYDRVPSQCMKINKDIFFKHDEDRFSQYLCDVDKGIKKLSGATLLPHELLTEAISILGPAKAQKKLQEMQTKVINQQWRTLVARIREAGTLDNAIAICDVSGSMGSLSPYSKGQPIFPAVALSILLSEIARPPWADHFITFSASPEMLSLDPTAGLQEKAKKMVVSSWGLNTDFNAVFTKLILPAATKAKLRPEDMVKRLFVFSDMQFDDSRPKTKKGTNSWETEHQIIKEAFEQAGYEIPEIVYWNLSNSTAKPITKDETGVAMLSGFSPNMLKIFLEGGRLDNISVVEEEVDDKVSSKKTLTPEETMLRVLGHESFSGLQVLD